MTNNEIQRARGGAGDGEEETVLVGGSPSTSFALSCWHDAHSPARRTYGKPFVAK